jgi:glycine/D-amino acid oxidase-like deaminating enzyme
MVFISISLFCCSLIDFHPKFANKSVILASPCSGHGFKFCSVIGEILKDLALHGETKHNISFFSINDRLDEEAHVSR